MSIAAFTRFEGLHAVCDQSNDDFSNARVQRRLKTEVPCTFQIVRVWTERRSPWTMIASGCRTLHPSAIGSFGIYRPVTSTTTLPSKAVSVNYIVTVRSGIFCFAATMLGGVDFFVDGKFVHLPEFRSRVVGSGGGHSVFI